MTDRVPEKHPGKWYFNFQVVLGRIKVEVESWEEVFNLSASFLFKFLQFEKNGENTIVLFFWFDFLLLDPSLVVTARSNILLFFMYQ